MANKELLEGWRKYDSRHPARRASLAHLCGVDDSGTWAVRVAGTVITVQEALEWMTPAEVKRAMEAGRTVLRQGDLYIVRTRCRKHDERGEYIDGRHTWSSDSRWLLHPEHAPLQVPFPAKLYLQNAYRMGRSGRRGAAD